MTTSFDWFFYQDITSEGWRDDTGMSLKEMREFIQDNALAATIVGRLNMAFGVSTIEVVKYQSSYTLQDEYAIRWGDETLWFADKAHLLLMTIMDTGEVPDWAIKEFQLHLRGRA